MLWEVFWPRALGFLLSPAPGVPPFGMRPDRGPPPHGGTSAGVRLTAEPRPGHVIWRRVVILLLRRRCHRAFVVPQRGELSGGHRLRVRVDEPGLRAGIDPADSARLVVCRRRVCRRPADDRDPGAAVSLDP